MMRTEAEKREEQEYHPIFLVGRDVVGEIFMNADTEDLMAFLMCYPGMMYMLMPVFWRTKINLDFPTYYEGVPDAEHYMEYYVYHGGVFRGAEKYLKVDLCLFRAARKGDGKLVKYFEGFGGDIFYRCLGHDSIDVEDEFAHLDQGINTLLSDGKTLEKHLKEALLIWDNAVKIEYLGEYASDDTLKMICEDNAPSGVILTMISGMFRGQRRSMLETLIDGKLNVVNAGYYSRVIDRDSYMRSSYARYAILSGSLDWVKEHFSSDEVLNLNTTSMAGLISLKYLEEIKSYFGYIKTLYGTPYICASTYPNYPDYCTECDIVAGNLCVARMVGTKNAAQDLAKICKDVPKFVYENILDIEEVITLLYYNGYIKPMKFLGLPEGK